MMGTLFSKFYVTQNWHNRSACKGGGYVCLSQNIRFGDSTIQVLSYEICENFKNTFFYRTPPVTASGSEYIFDLQIKIKDCG